MRKKMVIGDVTSNIIPDHQHLMKFSCRKNFTN